METKQRYFLKKNNRLKSRKAIGLLYSNGNSFNLHPLRVQYLFTDFAPGLKAGFSAPSRNFKKATDRNKIKRWLRESYRLQKNILEKNHYLQTKGLHLFFIYTAKEIPTYQILFDKTQLCIKKISAIIEGKTEAPHENN